VYIFLHGTLKYAKSFVETVAIQDKQLGSLWPNGGTTFHLCHQSSTHSFWKNHREPAGASPVLKPYKDLLVLPFTMNIRGARFPCAFTHAITVMLLDLELVRATQGIPFSQTTCTGTCSNDLPISSQFQRHCGLLNRPRPSTSVAKSV